MSKTASLTSELVTKKGQATPALPTNFIHDKPKASINSTNYYKSLTVKLDKQRYEALKNAGLKLDKKSQEIFVEALDLWLEKTANLSS